MKSTCCQCNLARAASLDRGSCYDALRRWLVFSFQVGNLTAWVWEAARMLQRSVKRATQEKCMPYGVATGAVVGRSTSVLLPYKQQLKHRWPMECQPSCDVCAKQVASPEMLLAEIPNQRLSFWYQKADSWWLHLLTGQADWPWAD